MKRRISGKKGYNKVNRKANGKFTAKDIDIDIDNTTTTVVVAGPGETYLDIAAKDEYRNLHPARMKLSPAPDEGSIRAARGFRLRRQR